MEISNSLTSLSEKLIQGEKVTCLKCKQGIYVPQNKECKVNHYYRCDACGDTIILEPNVEIEQKMHCDVPIQTVQVISLVRFPMEHIGWQKAGAEMHPPFAENSLDKCRHVQRQRDHTILVRTYVAIYELVSTDDVLVAPHEGFQRGSLLV